MAAPQQALLMAGGASTTSAVINSARYRRFTSSPTGVSFRSDGTVWVKDDSSGGAGFTSRYAWKTGTGTGADYEIRADVSTDPASPSAGVSQGTLGTWQALSSNRTWERSSSLWQEEEVFLNFQIRDTATQAILATGLIKLYAYYGTGPIP